uniref:Uncharacterized protein n=1 Tax=Candidatus Kentrum sp. LFY TaxID=2126342 RepID=A0A450UVS3_9GAMM|nr:MAG: hypothetical protein BECKLFY1418B_GA0070995_108712 [Candidatus Kentron sp. LFY]
MWSLGTEGIDSHLKNVLATCVIHEVFPIAGKALESPSQRLVAGYLARSSRIATAGSFLPSRNSRKAPPPVEM